MKKSVLKRNYDKKMQFLVLYKIYNKSSKTNKNMALSVRLPVFIT